MTIKDWHHEIVRKMLNYEKSFTEDYFVYNDYGFLSGYVNSYFEYAIFQLIQQNKDNDMHIQTKEYNNKMEIVTDKFSKVLPKCLSDIIYTYVRRYVPEYNSLPLDVPLSPYNKDDIRIKTNLFITTYFAIGFYFGVIKRYFNSLKVLVVTTATDLDEYEELHKYDIVLCDIDTFNALHALRMNFSFCRWNRLIIDNLEYCFYHGVYEIDWLCEEIKLQKANFTWFLVDDNFKKKQISWYYNTIINYDYKYNLINNGLKVKSLVKERKIAVFKYELIANNLKQCIEEVIKFINNDKNMIAYVIVRTNNKSDWVIRNLEELFKINEANRFNYFVVNKNKKFNKRKLIKTKNYRMLLDTEVNSIKNNDFTFVTDIFCIDDMLLDFEYPVDFPPFFENCMGINRKKGVLNFYNFAR